jgi:hypothetical protein
MAWMLTGGVLCLAAGVNQVIIVLCRRTQASGARVVLEYQR